MTKKLPKDLIPGDASDESVVHASDYTVGFSRGHKEGDIARLRTSVKDFSPAIQYQRDDFVYHEKFIYKNNTPNTLNEQFLESQWILITGITNEVKNYINQIIQGRRQKEEVKAATTQNITLSGLQTIDGIAIIQDDRVLVKNQTNQTENGIYNANATNWTRTQDADTGEKLEHATTYITDGTQFKQSYTCITDNVILGTTDIVFAQIEGYSPIQAGDGLIKTGDVLSIPGTTARIIVNSDSIDIDANYEGQSSITKVGTLDTGIWNATPILPSKIENGTFGEVLKSGLTTPEWGPTVQSMELLKNYDQTESYDAGNVALFSNIEQVALVDIPADQVYAPVKWLPINIHNSKLTTPNSFDFFKQQIQIDNIEIIDNNEIITISHPTADTALSHIQSGEFVLFDLTIGNQTIKIYGKITLVDAINFIYKIEIDSQRKGILQLSSSTSPPTYYTMENVQYLTNSDIIKGYIYNSKDFPDNKPHLTQVQTPANSLIHITHNILEAITDPEAFLTISLSSLELGIVTTRDETFDQDNLLLVTFGRESISHFHIASTTKWFVDIIQVIKENSQYDTDPEGLTLPYQESNPYRIGSKAIFHGFIEQTSIQNVSAGKDYDPEDWISRYSQTQVFPPNRISYGNASIRIGTILDNTINVEFLGGLHSGYQLNIGDFVGFSHVTEKYDSNVGQVIAVNIDFITGAISATIVFDPNKTLNFTPNQQVTILLLNFMGILLPTLGVIVNYKDSSDFLPHLHFISLTHATQPVYISPITLNELNNQKDIYISINDPHSLKYQDRDTSINEVTPQEKLFLATTTIATQSRFSAETNKYWLDFTSQAFIPVNPQGNKIPNLGEGTNPKDAANVGQVYNIASDEAVKQNILQQYSESASYQSHTPVDFNGMLQISNKDIAENTPYSAEDWTPVLEIQQNGLISPNSLAHSSYANFDFELTKTGSGDFEYTLFDPFSSLTSIIIGHAFKFIGAPILDGVIGILTQQINDILYFTMSKALGTLTGTERIDTLIDQNEIYLQTPAIGAIVNKTTDDKFKITPLEAQNPGLTSNIDKFNTGFDGWSVYDVAYASDSYYGSIAISNSSEHGGSLFVDLTGKGYSYYYYGGIQKQFTKGATDSWANIEVEWRSTATPQGNPAETDTKLLCRIFNPTDGTLLKEVILVDEFLLADSGWRDNTIDISDLNNYNYLLITIVFDDFKWIDPKQKLYIDNFKIERISGDNIHTINPADLNTSGFHKIVIINKDSPDEFSLIDPDINRDSLYDDNLVLGHIRKLTSKGLAGVTNRYYPKLDVLKPFRNLHEHFERRSLGGNNRFFEAITSTNKEFFFSLENGVSYSASTIDNIIEKEILLEELELYIELDNTANDHVHSLSAKLEILLNGTSLISQENPMTEDSGEIITLKVNKTFVKSDLIQIKVTYPFDASSGTLYNITSTLQAKIRRLGV